jgi:ATP-dependent RNA helicase UAP56/SUB2
VKSVAFFGGIPIKANCDQIKTLSPHVVIGTPGRILQLAKEKHLNLSSVKHFVLDECDKMLESLEMRGDVQKIFLLTPREKQTMMFSATLSDTIRPICKKFMHHPLEVIITDGSKLTLHGLMQYYVNLEEREKNRQLKDLLEALEYNQCVIFVKTVQRAIALQQLVSECQIPCICITANMKQPDRLAKFQEFKEFRARLLITTNLMGRGIDVERVNVVINYDMAEDADTYLHRVARAGRFDTKGLAISFVSSQEDQKVLEAVQKRFVVSIPSLPDEIDSTSYM